MSTLATTVGVPAPAAVPVATTVPVMVPVTAQEKDTAGATDHVPETATSTALEGNMDGMTNKILRGELENDSIGHFHDPSTPKHNKGRKRLRRSIKRKEATEAIHYEEDAG